MTSIPLTSSLMPVRQAAWLTTCCGFPCYPCSNRAARSAPAPPPLPPQLPNGTAFAITTQPQPELDDTHLPVGRVVSGGELVQQLLGLPRVKDNSGSPFFK